MALVVEDGTGLATAESYLSVADFRARASRLGLWYINTANPTSDWLSGLDDELVEGSLIRSTDILDGMYSDSWIGVRLRYDQALDWPRVGSRQSEISPSAMYIVGLHGRGHPAWPYVGYPIGSGTVIPSDATPRQVIDALCHITIREIVAPGSLSPDTSAGWVRSEAVAGAVSVTYEGGYVSNGRVPLVDTILRPIIHSGTSQSIGRA